jgi:hypothetical protein
MNSRPAQLTVVWVCFFLASVYNGWAYAQRLQQLDDAAIKGPHSPYWLGKIDLVFRAMGFNQNSHTLIALAILVGAVVLTVLISRRR